jgi:GxxExxY protein
LSGTESRRGLLHEGLTDRVIGAAIEVLRELGPGLLESAYEGCLSHELLHLGVPFRTQVEVPVVCKGKQIDCGYRADLLIDEAVIVELKSVERIQPIHEAQLMTYLRLCGKRVGLLINFNVPRLKDGVVRRVL